VVLVFCCCTCCSPPPNAPADPPHPQPISPSTPLTLNPSHPQPPSPSTPLTLNPSHPQTLSPSNPLTLNPSHPPPPTPRNTQLESLKVASPFSYEAPATPTPTPAPGATPLSEACAEVAAKVRENIRLRRGFVLAAPRGGVVGGYVHMPAGPGLGRIATAVALGPAAGGSVPQVRACVLCGLGGGFRGAG